MSRSPDVIIALTLVTIAALALSCADAPPTGPPAGIPAALVMISGSEQQVEAFGTLAEPLVVRVEDAYGDAVEGAVIVWSTPSGGSLDAESAQTDAAGEARAVWTLSGLPGAQTATAWGAGLDTLTFRATALALAPAELTLASGGGQVAEVGTTLDAPIAVRVLDDQGRPVVDAEVTWTTEHGSFDPAGPRTDGDGRAQASWTLGTVAGDQTAAIVVGDLDPVPVTAVGLPGPYESFTSLAPEIQWVPLAELSDSEALATPSIRVEDRYGNPVAGEPVTFTPGEDTAVDVDVVESGPDGVATAEGWSFPQEVGGYDLATTVGSGEDEGPRFGVNVYRPLALEQLWAGTRRNYTCGLDASGTAYCWDDGFPWGLLPARVGPDGTSFVELAGGFEAYGLTTEGALYSISVDPFFTRQETPPVPFEHIAAGQGHYCGLSSEGAAYCWGTNNSGALGRDTIEVGGGADRLDLTDAEPVEGAPPLVRLAAGWRHTCGLTAQGDAYCWGLNDWGQVGDSTQLNRMTARQVVGGIAFVSLALGHRFSCGLDAAGAVYCWGRDYLEDGTEVVDLAPVRVADEFQFTEIAAGEYHICGLEAGGQAFCWRHDFDGDGVFGDGTAEHRAVRRTPVAVALDVPITALAANASATCGVTDSGVVCWGKWDTLGFPYQTHPDHHLPVYVTAPAGSD